MKKYFIIEDYYTKEKNNIFKNQYPATSTYDNEIFNTLEEAREFCKKNNVKTYDISDDKKTIYYYWIEEREVDEDDEINEGYLITDNEENDTLIYDGNTDLYEVTADIFGYDDRFKVAEKLFINNLDRSKFRYEYFDYEIRYCTLYYNDEEIMTTENPTAVINKLKELGIYDSIIDDYMDGLKEIVFKR